MLLKNLGEFGLIERFRKQINTDKTVIVGSGDDCAVLAFDKSHYQLFTCDMLVEGVDFESNDDLKLVGRKALAVSISDIAACAGIPRYAVVSLGLPKRVSVKKVDQLSKGMFVLAKAYGINIVGGDISRSNRLTIDVAMLGLVRKKNLCLRQGAKIGDVIFVSGSLGGSIHGKHLSFIPRIKEAQYLTKRVKVNSMIDISDGLIQDLGHILEANRVGAVLYERLIPLSKQSDGISDAFYSGEDFELLFTLSSPEAKKLSKENKFGFRPIGQIMHKEFGLKMVNQDNQIKDIKVKGYRHF